MDRARKWIGKHQDFISLLLAILCSNLLFFNQRGWAMNPVYMAIAAVLLYLGIRQFWKQRQKLLRARVWQGIAFLGVLFSLMVVAGAKIVTGNSIGEGSWEFEAFNMLDFFWLFFYALIGMVLFFNLYLLSEDGKICRRVRPLEENAGKSGKKSWLIYSIVLAGAWCPVFIAYYPGIMPEDATISVAMALGQMPWDNHFPVFYSLIVGLFISIGNALHHVNLGIALYSIVQLAAMAALTGYFLQWLQKKGVNKIYVYFCLAYYAAAPLFGNYAIVMWKDPWFSGLLVLLAIFLYENVARKRQAFLEKKSLLVYTGLIVMMCLMRNNGIYIAVLINLCLLIVYRKHVKRVLAALAGSVLLVYLITGPIYVTVFSAESLFVESIGIPLQQMVRTVATGGNLDEEDQKFMDGLLPIEKYKDYYNPFLVDPVKWAPEFDNEYLESHKKEFFQTWWSMLTKNFGTYVEQYLMGTYGFWHIGGDSNYEFVKVQVAENEWGMYQSSPFESYLGYQMKDSLNGKYDYIATGLLVWLVFVDTVICWVKKRPAYIFPLLVMIGNWLTLMIATPTAFGVRYIFVCVLGLPLLIVYPWLVPKQPE